LIDLIIKAKKKISRLNKEKDILIDKIAQYELDMSHDDHYRIDTKKDATLSSDNELNTTDKLLQNATMRPTDIDKKRPETKRSSSSTSQSKRKRSLKEKKDKTKPIEGETPTENKKRRPYRQFGDTRKVQDVPRDETGTPIFPVKVGPLTVIQLGTIVYDREKFHNYRYIWPVGFETTRSYFSIRNPEKHVLYRSRILDGGDGPIFQVTPEDDPDNIVTAPAASAAWTTIMRKVNEARNKEHTSSASGPEYFGFGYPPIARLINAKSILYRILKYLPMSSSSNNNNNLLRLSNHYSRNLIWCLLQKLHVMMSNLKCPQWIQKQYGLAQKIQIK
jgi:hypothetical protein